jgi:uncharacterized protein
MNQSRKPLQAHVLGYKEFLRHVLANRINATILERLLAVNLPDCMLVAGCLFQSVWNGLTGRPATYGISDYDLFYYDPTDLSWEAEDQVIRSCATLFSDVEAEIQVRNQARVHLWYPQKFGIECAPLLSSRDGIDTFLNQSSCFGIESEQDGNYTVYAPFGYDDLFTLTVRPNPRRAVPTAYYHKASRWQACWPELTVIPWPMDNAMSKL